MPDSELEKLTKRIDEIYLKKKKQTLKKQNSIVKKATMEPESPLT